MLAFQASAKAMDKHLALALPAVNTSCFRDLFKLVAWCALLKLVARCLVCYGIGCACSLNFGVVRFERSSCVNPLLVVSSNSASNAGWLSYCFGALAPSKALKLQLVLGAQNHNSVGVCPWLVFEAEHALAQLVA
ncbi:hypothetical protein AAHH84_00125 [Candidatus Hodgkinia cicadicola]